MRTKCATDFGVRPSLSAKCAHGIKIIGTVREPEKSESEIVENSRNSCRKARDMRLFNEFVRTVARIFPAVRLPWFTTVNRGGLIGCSMEGIAPFAAAFLLISVMELGDKTQFLVISLSTKHRPLPVAAGAFVGETAVTAIGVAIGLAIATTVPILYVRLLSGALFIGFGAWSLRPTAEAKEAEPEETPRSPFFKALGLAFLAELGDKTMIAVIGLSGT